jgi:hypothetical protein
MTNKNIIATLKLNTNILLVVIVLFSLINLLCFFGGMNKIISNLDNSYVMFKGKQNNTDVCFAIKATRQLSKNNLDRVKLDSITKVKSIVNNKSQK